MSRLLVLTALIPTVALAVVPVNGTTPTLTPVTINGTAGDQFDPHVSGDWAAYTSDIGIRYYNFATTNDAAIPLGASVNDLLSDVSGSKVVFSRVTVGNGTTVMVFDAATAAAPVEVDPAVNPNRFGAAIGGSSVAYIDFGLQANGELVVSDLVTHASTRITNDGVGDGNPSVAPNGNVVVWEHCASSITNCDIYQAVKTGALWSTSVVSDSSNPEGNPDTNGTLVVYDSHRAPDEDIYWRPVGVGAETQLQMPGYQGNPSIAGDYIAFESRASVVDAADIYVYDMVTNKLYQITTTALINEQLNDITVLADGRVRVVWASDEDGPDQRNVKGATFALRATAPTCQNRSVVLDATRNYGTCHNTDGNAVTSGGAMTFALPASISVTAGNAGNGSVVFSFHTGAGQTTSCHYRSGGHTPHPQSASDLAKASHYDFDYCSPGGGSNGLHAGSIVSGDHFNLHVVVGDTWKPTTQVHLVLGEVCGVTPPPPTGGHHHGGCGHHHDDDDDGDHDDDGHHDDDDQGDHDDGDHDHHSGGGSVGHHSDELSGTPDEKPGVQGCSSASGAPTFLMLLAVAAWFALRRQAPVAVVVRNRK